ncbi:hypothetical protein POM88_010184 [Heracleum sosnowskyi]|uniref:Uncharacterized protein n=1 Tax=Heracleum sosnowskyi TaxID=360622 RepID=A0AAD8N968_9APIA|nr:hypothetical protein POM88_010184 [Heracleum sosnowskyi]
MVLADVQNDKRVVRNYRESSSPVDGGPTADKVKVSGTKRLTTESPTSHPWPPRPDHTATKEHLVYTTQKSKFVPGNKKTENTDRNMSSPPLKRFCSMQQKTPQKQSRVVETNTHQVHMAPSNYMVPKNVLSYSNPSLHSLPTSFASPGNGAGPAETVCLNDTSKVALPSDSKRVQDQKIGQNWEERYINLQNYLKICDSESTHKNQIQILGHLSPVELSMYAVELEKRAIQLTIEEGKEFQRMKALKILEKSAASLNASQKSEPSPSKK